MNLKVLGCHGGELLECRSTCFLVDDCLALDAGALTRALSLEQLLQVDDVVLTHSHFDHVKDLPMMTDLIIGAKDRPLTIWSSTECSRALKKSIFNGAVWPDFTRISVNGRTPVVRLKSFKPGASFKIGRYKIRSIPVTHPVESCGFVVDDGKDSIAISGDTGPTKKLWQVLNATKNLRALLLETSFPNSLQRLADLSGHLTPQTLVNELKKFDRRECEVLLYHLKPAHLRELKRELKGLSVRILELDDAFEF